MCLFVSHVLTYNYHPFFLPSSFKLPLIHSSMTLTSAPISPFCLILFTVSLNSPLFPRYYFSMCEWWSMHVSNWVTKKKTLYNLGYLSLSPGHNGPLTLQIEKEGNKNRREWHPGSECCNITGAGVDCRLRYEPCILKYLWSRGLNMHTGSMSFMLDGGYTASTHTWTQVLGVWFYSEA